MARSPFDWYWLDIDCVNFGNQTDFTPIDTQTHYLHPILIRETIESTSIYISDIPPSAYSSRNCGSTNASQSDACVGNRPIL